MIPDASAGSGGRRITTANASRNSLWAIAHSLPPGAVSFGALLVTLGPRGGRRSPLRGPHFFANLSFLAQAIFPLSVSAGVSRHRRHTESHRGDRQTVGANLNDFHLV